MKKSVFPVGFLIVLFFIMTACSPSEKTVPVTETPVLQTGQTVQFTLLQTTDLHHHVVGSGPSESYGTTHDTTEGGYSRLATTINGIRNAKASSGIPTVLVDSGDFFMGTVYDMSLGKNPAALMFFKSLKYDAITLGNHEFDYGPKPLAGFLNLAITGSTQFNVPIVASNMTGDGVSGTDDDGIEAYQASGVIKESVVLTLSNGLKVGILGFLGPNAENDAPVRAPLTFNPVESSQRVWNYKAIQKKVLALKNAGAQVVIALSHAGVTSTDSTNLDYTKWSGDDIKLAQNVMGIDIIASGHDHVKTGAAGKNDNVVTVPYKDNANSVLWNTRIICAGNYGGNLSQLDVTVTVGSGISAATLTNNTISHDIEQNGIIKTYMVGALDKAINEAVVAKGLPEINKIIAGTDSSNLDIPKSPGQTGMGNLVADSLRYLLGGAQGNPSLGIVANGVIRNGFSMGQQISFADIYNTLPLGMTLDPDNQNIPGYPLLMVYMDQTSILNLCKLAAMTIAAQDPVYMANLLTISPMTYGVLLNLKSDYYLNFSGIRYTYGADYSVAAGSVALYGPTDFSCQSAPPIPLAGLGTSSIPCVIDLYTALMFMDSSMQALLTSAGLTIQPKVMVNSTLTAMTTADLALSARLDRDTNTTGVQEVKEWMGLLQFVTNPTSSAGLNSLIPDSKYGSTVTANGQNASRVNHP